MTPTDPNAEIMPRRDWFAVERRVFHDEMFVGDIFSRRDAWLWLIANAAKRDHHIGTRGGIVELKRGEVIIARDYLAKIWGWTPSRVRTFLDQLRSADRLSYRQSTGHYANVAKVQNYKRFQDFEAGSPQSDRQSIASQFPESGEESQKRLQCDRQSERATNADNSEAIGAGSENRSPVKPPVDRQSVASGSPHPYTYKDSSSIADSAKLPKQPSRKSSSKLTADERREAEQALADYNTAATTLKFSRAGSSDARLDAIAKRLREIGQGDMAAGRERFREALSAIPHDAFIAGRVKAQPDREPYKLTLERLLGTGSKMGDVLAKLGDLYAERGPAQPVADHPEPPSSCIDAWREAQAEELAAQRARWAPAAPTSEAADAVH